MKAPKEEVEYALILREVEYLLKDAEYFHFPFTMVRLEWVILCFLCCRYGAD